MAKQDDFTRYTIRVPTELYDRLKHAAGVKSVNAEIIERLELTFERFHEFNAVGMGAFAKRLEASLSAAEILATKLAEEVRLAGGVVFEEDERISAALNEAAADTGLSKVSLVQGILEEWLKHHDFLGPDGKPT